MKHLKIVLAVVGVMIVAVISYDFYLRWQTDNLLGELRNRERLRIPRDVRIALTDGTAEGTAKGARWLEQQLESRQGSLAALYVLNSLMSETLGPLPRPLGFFLPIAGMTRWRQRHAIIDGLNRCMAEENRAIEAYFRRRDEIRFRPLPKVNWGNPVEIEGRALAAIESGNTGFLLILFHGIASAEINPLSHSSQGLRIRFHRAGERYDVQWTPTSADKFIRYDVIGREDSENLNRAMWLQFQVAPDFNGMWGITLLGFTSSPYTQTQPSTTQPFAPSWSDPPDRTWAPAAPSRRMSRP